MSDKKPPKPSTPDTSRRTAEPPTAEQGQADFTTWLDSYTHASHELLAKMYTAAVARVHESTGAAPQAAQPQATTDAARVT